MSTLVVGDHDWLSAQLERRHALGQDTFDEVWDGVHHVAPQEQPQNSIVAAEILHALRPQAALAGLITSNPFNLGTGKDEFRCPDGGWLRTGAPLSLYTPTAVAVLEVLSTGDETYAKFPFYLGRAVQEVLVAHPAERWVRCYHAELNDYVEHDRSNVFDISMAQLHGLITWP